MNHLVDFSHTEGVVQNCPSFRRGSAIRLTLSCGGCKKFRTHYFPFFFSPPPPPPQLMTSPLRLRTKLGISVVLWFHAAFSTLSLDDPDVRKQDTVGPVFVQTVFFPGHLNLSKAITLISLTFARNIPNYFFFYVCGSSWSPTTETVNYFCRYLKEDKYFKTGNEKCSNYGTISNLVSRLTQV